jgi:tellurium resistance protein TerD
MAISLVKNEPISLTKNEPALSELRFELHWNPERLESGAIDLDISVFCLDANGKTKSDYTEICFFNNQDIGYCKHIKGDNKTGISKPGEPDEVVVIKLDQVPAHIVKLDSVITIDKAKTRGISFKNVNEPYACLFNNVTNELIGKIVLKDIDPDAISAQFYSIYRNGSEWMLELISKGHPADFVDYVHAYIS